MEKLEITYNEYVRLVERHDKILDSSFNDIKLFGVVGTAIGFIGALKKSGFLDMMAYQEEVYFVIILVLFFLIAIISYRDLLKQVYIVHLTYNIKKMEDYFRENYFEDDRIFRLRKSWHEKYFPILKRSYSAFVLIFFIPLIILPIFLFWENDSMIYGITMSTIMVVILAIYSILVNNIYESGRKNETANNM